MLILPIIMIAGDVFEVVKMFECHVALGLVYLIAVIICFLHLFVRNPMYVLVHFIAEGVILACFIAYLCVGVDWHSTSASFIDVIAGALPIIHIALFILCGVSGVYDDKY